MKTNYTPFLLGGKELSSRYNLVSMDSTPRVMLAVMVLFLNVSVTLYALYMHLKLFTHSYVIKQNIT